MHTTRADDVVFIHDGDYSGDVHVVVKGCFVEDVTMLPATGEDSPRTLVWDNHDYRITIPFEAMEQLVANKISSELISKIEQESAEEILRRGAC